MSTATLPAPTPTLIPDGIRLLTAADVAVLPRTLPSGDVGYELHDGRLVVMAPPGAGHGRRQARIVAHLFASGEQPGHGQAFAEVGVLLRRNPDHLRCPDAAFVTTAQLPTQLSPEGYMLTIPELMIEVRSKSNTQSDIDEKVNDYLKAGAALVWVADPDARTLTAYQSKKAPTVLAATDTLTAPSVIPGFAVLVGDLLPE
jgi:Uma2 family endonuclease